MLYDYDLYRRKNGGMLLKLYNAADAIDTLPDSITVEVRGRRVTVIKGNEQSQVALDDNAVLYYASKNLLGSGKLEL